MPARKRSRQNKRERIAKEGMGPIIPRRKLPHNLSPVEKSGVYSIGGVVGDIFEAQVEGRYKFEIRCNFNALGHAWVPQFVVPGGPNKFVWIRGPSAAPGKGGTELCGVFPLRGSMTMNCEPETKLDIPADVVEAWKAAALEASKKKPRPNAKPREWQKYNHSNTRAALYTVYKIDKPVWLGTTDEYKALKKAKQFPWAAEE